MAVKRARELLVAPNSYGEIPSAVDDHWSNRGEAGTEKMAQENRTHTENDWAEA